jgi:hypothetical protein
MPDGKRAWPKPGHAFAPGESAGSAKRDLISRMISSARAADGGVSEPALHPDGPPGHAEARLHWRFYDCMVDPDSGRHLSEELAFCRLWRGIGGKIWVDLECKLNDLGQHMFRGDLAESLRVRGRW